MAPVGYGVLALIGGAMFLAVLVGAVGGAIYGRYKGDLFLGAILVAAAYVLLSFCWNPFTPGRSPCSGCFR